MEREEKTRETSAEEEEQAQLKIWKYAFGFSDIAAVKCAIDLGLADVLENHQGPMPLSDLSSAVGCNPSALHRIMRFLVYRGVFIEAPTNQGSKGYAQTPLSRLLTNGERSLAAMVLFQATPVMLAPWLRLSGRVRAGGGPAFDAVHGKDVWAYAATNPDHSKLLNDAMGCDARVAVAAIVEGCPELLRGLNTVVDVGGGDGSTLRLLVQAFPGVRGINFDLPHVVSEAPACVGVEHVGGNMFHSVPKADAAFMKWVLHDWGDEECIQILRQCREAVPKDKGKVIIVDAVIHEDGEEDDNLEYVRLMLDMAMMAQTTAGKERTLKEWEIVLKEAGFSRFTVNRIKAVQSVIEAYP
ncbi:hypothetical protein NMG60_11015869 [Bertholletia excelsa]